MMLCVNANPAIDKTVVVNRFRLGEIHRPLSVLALPGGKGANVAKALKRLGESSVVLGWVGGFNGRFIEAGLRAEGIDTAFVQVEAESRTCLSVVDQEDGTVTEIYERGEPIPAEKVEVFTGVFSAMLGSCSAVTLSGSLPPGVPSGFYAELISLARVAGVPVYLDSSGEALKQGLAARPALIKPNAKEFAGLTGQAPASMDELAQAAIALAQSYGTVVAISRGADGVLCATEGEIFTVRPPNLDIKSAVGSGDCLLGGIAYGLTHGYPLREAVRYGVAAGTANALSIGAGLFSMDDFERVLPQVKVVE